MMDLLSHRHALVTGGGTGIGAAIARALAEAVVTIAGRRRALLDEVAADLPKVPAVTADVTSEADCATMVTAARAVHGPIDMAIANAGTTETAPAGRFDLSHWQRMIDVNRTGTFLTVRAALADVTRKPAQPGRRLIFVASTAGLKGYPYVAAYCAAKRGVVGVARALSVELARDGVTANVVCPGFVDTALLAESVSKVSEKTGRSATEARPLLAQNDADGRLINSDEVAQTVLWLFTPAADSISGQAIAVAGGQA